MKNQNSFAIAGAGLSGVVVANRLALEGHLVHVYESRNLLAEFVLQSGIE